MARSTSTIRSTTPVFSIAAGRQRRTTFAHSTLVEPVARSAARANAQFADPVRRPCIADGNDVGDVLRDCENVRDVRPERDDRRSIVSTGSKTPARRIKGFVSASDSAHERTQTKVGRPNRQQRIVNPHGITSHQHGVVCHAQIANEAQLFVATHSVRARRVSERDHAVERNRPISMRRRDDPVRREPAKISNRSRATGSFATTTSRPDSRTASSRRVREFFDSGRAYRSRPERHPDRENARRARRYPAGTEHGSSVT